ncbi:MAG: S9 family peptidase [Candidatus Dormibacteria bacterium]
MALEDPRLSPNSRDVVFTRVIVDAASDARLSEVWSVPTDGSSGPVRHSRPGEMASLARWSPDGLRVAYARHSGDGTSDLLLSPWGGAQTKVLARFKAPIEALEWSPDARHLAFLARLPDEAPTGSGGQPLARRIDALVYRLDTEGWLPGRHRHLFVANLADGKVTQLTSGPYEDAGLAWSPDSSSLIFTSARHAGWDRDLARDLFKVSLGGDEPVRITATGPVYQWPSWSADGGRLAAVADLSPLDVRRHSQVVTMSPDGSDPRSVTGDLGLGVFSEAPRGSRQAPGAVDAPGTVQFLVEDGGALHLYEGPVDASTRPWQLVGGDRWISAWDSIGGLVVFVAASIDQAPEVFAMDAGGQERRLTQFGEETLRGVRLATARAFSSRSRTGPVPAWILPPATYVPGRRYPTLLQVHGGPHLQHGHRFHPELQLLANADYAVIFANPRGSTGYSEQWLRGIRGGKSPIDPAGGHGAPAFEDLMDVVDAAIERFDFIDPDRLGILGKSYGGFMTAWSIAHSNRFKAAVCDRASINLLTLNWRGDGGFSFLEGTFGVSHLDDPAEYLRNSPITYVDGIHTPLLIAHGEDDRLCPLEQAEQLFLALRTLGREVEFITLPKTSHLAISPLREVDLRRRTIAWFDKYLKKEA